MARVHYCWRCRIDVPMLDDEEWEQVAPLLTGTVAKIKEYRHRTGASLVEAKSQDWGRDAREKYFELTGFHESNEVAIWHHRLALCGPPCPACGKLLRTKTARVCAECWRPILQENP